MCVTCPFSPKNCKAKVWLTFFQLPTVNSRAFYSNVMLQSLLQFLHLCFRSKIRLTSSVPERAFSIVVIWAQQPGWAESFVLLGQALTSKVHNRRVFNSLGFIRTDFQTHLLCPGHPNLLDPPGYEGDKSPNWKAGWHSLSSQQLITAHPNFQRRQWQPTPVFLPGKSQGQGSLAGCCLWGRTESDTTEAT